MDFYPQPTPVNASLYHYAGNNPIVYSDPSGLFDCKQFTFAAIQTIGGFAEVTASCAAAVSTGGLSAGLTIYGIVDGLTNIADSIAGMVTASKNIEYRGIVAEGTTMIAEDLGMSNEGAELLGDTVSLIKATADMDVLKLPSLVKGFETGSKAVEVVDKLIECSGRTCTYESAIEYVHDIFSQENN